MATRKLAGKPARPFAVGDRVRVKQDIEYSCFSGYVCRIEQVISHGNVMVEVTEGRMKGATLCFGDGELEKIK